MSRQKAVSRSPRLAARTALGNDGFIPHTRKLLESDAWRTRPIHVVRFIEFLEAEHLKHCGRENGFLIAPYDQLERCGISRRLITGTINDAVKRGLVHITHRGGYGKRTASRYQLTYLAWKLNGATGPEYIEPTNQWRHYQAPPKRPCDRKRDSTGRFTRAARLTLVITSGRTNDS